MLPLFSKLILPIELGSHLKNSDEGIAPGDANDDCEDVDDDTFNWSLANILQNAEHVLCQEENSWNGRGKYQGTIKRETNLIMTENILISSNTQTYFTKVILFLIIIIFQIFVPGTMVLLKKQQERLQKKEIKWNSDGLVHTKSIKTWKMVCIGWRTKRVQCWKLLSTNAVGSYIYSWCRVNNKYYAL